MCEDHNDRAMLISLIFVLATCRFIGEVPDFPPSGKFHRFPNAVRCGGCIFDMSGSNTLDRTGAGPIGATSVAGPGGSGLIQIFTVPVFLSDSFNIHTARLSVASAGRPPPAFAPRPLAECARVTHEIIFSCSVLLLSAPRDAHRRHSLMMPSFHFTSPPLTEPSH